MTTYRHKLTDEKTEREYWDNWNSIMTDRNQEIIKRHMGRYGYTYNLDNEIWMNLFEYNFEHTEQ